MDLEEGQIVQIYLMIVLVIKKIYVVGRSVYV